MVATEMITAHLAADIPVHSMEMRVEVNAGAAIKEAAMKEVDMKEAEVEEVQVEEAIAEVEMEETSPGDAVAKEASRVDVVTEETEETGPVDAVVPMNLIKDLRVIEAGAEAKVPIRMKEKIAVEMNTASRSDLAWVEEVPSEVEEAMTMTQDHQADSEVAVKE